MGYVDKDRLQRFFDGLKEIFASKDHTHNYAGSSSSGGSATSAEKLDTTTAGSSTKPVYFSGGKPVVCDYSLGSVAPKTVRTLSTAGPSGWSNLPTDQNYVPDMAFIAYWNGAYSTVGASNLAYCNRGAFGTAATAAKTDFATADHNHDSTYLKLAGGTVTDSVTVSKSGATDSGFVATNSDTGKSVALMVGSGKQNRGVYDKNKGQWMVYADENNNVLLNGTANSAAKLATARTISASDDYVMSFSFDGSANVSTSLRAYNALIAKGNKNNYPYHRFAKLDAITGNYVDKTMTFLITQDYDGGGYGICRIVLRTNNQTTSSKQLSSVSVEWITRCNLSADSIQIGLYTDGTTTYADAFFKAAGTYTGTVIRNLGSGARSSIARTWTLINSNEVNDTTASDKLTSYEVYTSIANAGTSLHNKAYTSTVSGKDNSTVALSNKATQDSAGQQINTTYLKSLSSKNGVVTYTKGNNSTGTIDTQDNFITLTQSQYDTLVSSGKIDENCYYFITDMLSSPTLIQYVTLSVSGWTASSDSTYYTQKVTAAHITENDNPMVIKNLSYSTGATEAKKYLKAFSILCSGVAETADGSVTWKVFKKPATDISVGLIKVLE